VLELVRQRWRGHQDRQGRTPSGSPCWPAPPTGLDGACSAHARPGGDRRRSARWRFKKVIVLEPDRRRRHGAQKNGTVEKDVVLAFSYAGATQLNATGRYKVLMNPRHGPCSWS